ncbi:signal peptidase I [Psittacicella gerlachiana]|uniref:Signal peptidase I n=1 Tax=Psittacicella gerlachiana TaxID=2028574 RepID=A0A3A1YHB1_9GAMM|nr:signal peptidase I [Psittacicella gerlachiana]RIY36450.1 signal peptidase I [Psittacicella gerlachiana]
MKKYASLSAFITVIVLFIILYNIFINGFANALSIIWVIMLLVFLAAYVVRRWVYVPRFQRAMAQELGLADPEAEIKNNKELKKGAALKARRTYLGELSSYFWFFFIIFLFRSFIYEPFKIPSGSMQPTLQIGDYIAVNKHYYRLHDPIWQKTIIRLAPVERGDIVVFKAPTSNEDWIKRVLGLPGDIVHYDQDRQKFQIISGCTNPEEVAKNINWQNLSNLGNNCQVVNISYGAFTTDYNYFYYNNYQLVRSETLTSSQGESLTHYTLQNPQAFDYANARGIYRQSGLPALTWVIPADHYFMIGDNRDNSQDSRFVGPIAYQAIVGKAEFIWFALKYDASGNMKGVNFSRIFTGLYPHISLTN